MRVEPRSLNREAVLHAALQIVDVAGVDALTVKQVADRLGVPQTTLYTYFSNKAELVTLLYFRVAAQLFQAGVGHHPRQILRTFADSVSRALQQHPHWASLLLRPAPALESVERERLLERLVACGLRVEDAWTAVTAILLTSLGFSLVGSALAANALDAALDDRIELARQSLAPRASTFPLTLAALRAAGPSQLLRMRDFALDGVVARFTTPDAAADNRKG